MLLFADIRRIHRFPCQECDVSAAVFDESAVDCSNLRTAPAVFSRLFDLMRATEIAIDADRRVFKLRTFRCPRVAGRAVQSVVARERDRFESSVHMNSVMTLETGEFDSYSYQARRARPDQRPVEIIFCLKEVGPATHSRRVTIF